MAENHAGTGITELIQEYDAFCLGKNAGSVTNPTEEDFLQRLLSYLLTLPDLMAATTPITNEWETVETFLDQVWNILRPNPSHNDNDTPPDNHSTSTTTSNAPAVWDSWEKGLILASRVANGLSPTELHGVASSLIFLADTTTTTSTTAAPLSTTTFVTTCLLLCCRALLQCPAAPIERRWKRWQSLLLETVRLYQLFILAPWTSIRPPNGKTSSREVLQLHLAHSVRLWSYYVSPALAHLQQALVLSPLASSGSLSTHRWMALEAGTTECVTRLVIWVFLLQPQDHNNNIINTQHPSRLLQELVESWDSDILHGHYEGIYEHPWRQLETYRSSETVATESWALTYYTTNQHCTSDEQREDRRERALGMDTVWSPLGIAVLVATQGWEKRPYVWTGQYAWRMFFPHVSVLLLGYHNADIEEDDGNEESNSENGGTNNISNFARLGFQLLQNLLQTTRQCSLSSPGPSSSAADCPIGTCQLIANQIINGSTQENAFNNHRNTSLSLGNYLPSAGHSFQLLKSLVGKYNPMYQIQLVQELYEHCPHPGLRPKILDILRPFVTWNNSAAEQRVCRFLEEEFLRKLEEYVLHTMDDDGMQDLVDNVEVYTAAMGLIQLWLLYRKSDDAAFFPGGRLTTRLVSLQNRLEQLTFGSANNGHTEQFRLHLLENSLRQTLHLLSVRNESASG